MPYVTSFYMYGGKPHTSITEVVTLGEGDATLIRPASRDRGWVRRGGARLFATEAEARSSLINEMDVFAARLANMRAALWDKSIRKNHQA